MNCPECGSNQVCVINSRSKEDFVFRRRRCLDCNARFNTFEIHEARFNSLRRYEKNTGCNEAKS